MRCRIATNKSPVFDPKTLLSSYFMIFRRLQQLNSICVLDQVTLLITCYYWLRSYLCLLLLEREYPVIWENICDICLIFYRPQTLSFLSLPKQRTSQSIFFLGDFYEFSRKNEWVQLSKEVLELSANGFYSILSRIFMTLTRSLRKKRIVKSTRRNTL